MRRSLTLPLAAGTLLPLALATPAGAAGNGVAGKNAPAIVAASLAAMRAAPSFSLDGITDTVGETIGIHLTVSTHHGSKGTLTINGDAVHLLQIGQVVYFSAGKSFWNKQGGSAIASISAGFHAVTIWRRESGFVRIDSITLAIWSMPPPWPSGQLRHCEP